MNANASQVIQGLSDDEMKNIDFIAVFDHSGSMERPSLRFPNKTRWQELQEDAESLCRKMAKWDSDGITVVPFSSSARILDGVTVDAVTKLFNEVEPGGGTDLTSALQLAIAKAEGSTKNVVIGVWTDGSPNDAKSVFDLINAAGQKLGRPKLGIVFMQVGQEPDARQFLDSVNNNLKVDVVGVTAPGQAETLTLQQIAWIAQNG